MREGHPPKASGQRGLLEEVPPEGDLKDKRREGDSLPARGKSSAKIAKYLEAFPAPCSSLSTRSVHSAVWWAAGGEVAGKESLDPQEVLWKEDKRLGFCADGQREILNGFSREVAWPD